MGVRRASPCRAARIFGWFAFVVFALSGCGGNGGSAGDTVLRSGGGCPSVERSSGDNQLNDLPWEELYFAHDGLQGAYVKSTGINVPARFEGLSSAGVMQLDLGSDQTVLYGKPYESLSAQSRAARTDDNFAGYKTNVATFSGSIVGCNFADANLPILQNFGDEPASGKPANLGTIGTDFFENRILIIDFVQGRVAVLNSDVQLPQTLLERARFVPLIYKRGQIYVGLAINGRNTAYMYDTGSDSFPLLTSRADWQALTGLNGDESGLTTWLGMAWGRQEVFRGAPLRGDLCLDQDCLSHPLVFFNSSKDSERGFKGLFGDRLFQDRYVVIIDIARRRFGLVRVTR
jgi:hypothetical protein